MVKPAIVVCSRRVKTSASVPCIDSFRARKSQEPQRRSKIRKLERSPGDAIVFQKGAVTGPPFVQNWKGNTPVTIWD